MMDANKHMMALVRIRVDVLTASVDPPGRRQFRAGEECVMFKVGDAWWDSLDVDAAHIIAGDHAEVIDILG